MYAPPLILARRLVLRLRMAWLRAREVQLAMAAQHMLLDPQPGTGPRLAVLLARSAAVRCEIVALELSL